MIKNLDRAASLESLVPETPYWHAPVYGAAIGGALAWVALPDQWFAIPALLAALTMWGLVAVDSRRRRRLRGRRQRQLTSEVVGAFVVMGIVSLAACLVWVFGLVQPAIDDSGASLRAWAVIPLWLASSAILLGGMVVINRYRTRLLRVQP